MYKKPTNHFWGRWKHVVEAKASVSKRANLGWITQGYRVRRYVLTYVDGISTKLLRLH